MWRRYCRYKGPVFKSEFLIWSFHLILTVIAHKVARHQAERRDHLKTWYCSGEVRTHLANWKIFFFFYCQGKSKLSMNHPHFSGMFKEATVCVIGGWVKCSSRAGRCFCAENLRHQHYHIRGVINTGMYKTIMWFSGMKITHSTHVRHRITQRGEWIQTYFVLVM